MFKDYQKKWIRGDFTVEEIDIALNRIDEIVDKQFLGTEEEAEKEMFFDERLVDRIEREGYYVIPMNRYGVAFDYGDTSSGGVMLPDCVPFGDSKEEFKNQLVEIFTEMKEILK